MAMFLPHSFNACYEENQRKPLPNILKKSLLSVCGELQTRSYDDQQGQTHYVTELVVDGFEFLESKATVEQREQKHHGVEPNRATPPINEPTPNQQPANDDPYCEQPPMDGMSDYGYNQ